MSNGKQQLITKPCKWDLCGAPFNLVEFPLRHFKSFVCSTVPYNYVGVSSKKSCRCCSSDGSCGNGRAKSSIRLGNTFPENPAKGEQRSAEISFGAVTCK